ncbi:hypothetical protein RSAG8_13043, partial [Rhizoctonia solani AG-8 WAC10335]
MTNLLPERIPLIIPDDATTLALVLVNKHYNDMVTPILYKAATLEGIDDIKAFSYTMVSGRPKLRQYLMHLYIVHMPRDSLWDGTDPDNLIAALMIKQILMHVPNLIDLALALDEPIYQYLVEEPRYPFKLHSLQMTPIWDDGFFEFLRTQPEIEAVTFWDDLEDDHSPLPGAPLQLDILPKLGSISGGKRSVSIMVPLHPVTEVTLSGVQRNLDVHEKISQSLAPLDSLSESIRLTEKPWESVIVSRCLPSLGFCWKSLSEYSLSLEVSSQFDQNSVLSFLKERVAPSHGLEIIRTSLSTFSALRILRLNFYPIHLFDLTSEFCETIPELSRFDVWKESCPTLEEVRLFGLITLKNISWAELCKP